MRFPSVTMGPLSALSWVSCLVATIRGCGKGLYHQKMPSNSATAITRTAAHVHQAAAKVRGLETPEVACRAGFSSVWVSRFEWRKSAASCFADSLQVLDSFFSEIVMLCASPFVLFRLSETPDESVAAARQRLNVSAGRRRHPPAPPAVS